MSKTIKNKNEQGAAQTMADLNTGKPTQAEQQQALNTLIEQETSNNSTQLIEREGVKYLVKQLNGLTIETRMS